jgi:hypothetical protein
MIKPNKQKGGKKKKMWESHGGTKKTKETEEDGDE